jgi:RimJ/RimL family protein N-acetyltransferase
MTEATEAVTDFWFNSLGFRVMRVHKAIENTGSRRISERNGIRIVGTEERDYVSGRFLTELWEITADEWNVRKAGRGHDRS